jgi:hypothetical protein
VILPIFTIFRNLEINPHEYMYIYPIDCKLYVYVTSFTSNWEVIEMAIKTETKAAEEYSAVKSEGRSIVLVLVSLITSTHSDLEMFLRTLIVWSWRISVRLFPKSSENNLSLKYPLTSITFHSQSLALFRSNSSVTTFDFNLRCLPHSGFSEDMNVLKLQSNCGGVIDSSSQTFWILEPPRNESLILETEFSHLKSFALSND